MTYSKYAKITIVLYAIYCTYAANDASDKYDSLTSSRSRMWRCFSIPEKRERNHAGWPGREVGWRWDEKNFAALFRRWSLSFSLVLVLGFVGKQKQSERLEQWSGQRSDPSWSESSWLLKLGAVNRLGGRRKRRDWRREGERNIPYSRSRGECVRAARRCAPRRQCCKISWFNQINHHAKYSISRYALGTYLIFL